MKRPINPHALLPIRQSSPVNYFSAGGHKVEVLYSTRSISLGVFRKPHTLALAVVVFKPAQVDRLLKALHWAKQKQRRLAKRRTTT